MGPIAQSVEQRTFNPWVDGSSPSGPTIFDYTVEGETLVRFFQMILQTLSRRGKFIWGTSIFFGVVTSILEVASASSRK